MLRPGAGALVGHIDRANKASKTVYTLMYNFQEVYNGHINDILLRAEAKCL